MKLQRLRQMDRTEIAVRTRQEAWKWWDRWAADARPAPARGRFGDRPRARAIAEAAPAHFFAGAADERTPALLAERVPEHAPAIVAAAERTLAGRFDLLGYRGLSFGQPVDWRLDPVSGRRAPMEHWSRLDPLDGAVVGDSKVVWELNRHQWMVTLGQAYRLTGDERYAASFAAQARSWLDANPAGRGINWASSLEVALRLMAWCWALVLFRTSPALTPELCARLRHAVDDHAAHVERYLSLYFSPNTHLTGEVLGLFYAGTVFPELPRAQQWRERAALILAAESDRQVLPDGVYFEQSPCYQRYTVEILMHFLILCGRNGWTAPAALGQRVQAMLDFLLALRSPGGTLPAIGDSDGGWLLPLSPRGPGDARGVFGVAAALFSRTDFAWAAGGAPPELPWMLGSSGLAAFDALRAQPPAAPASRAFPAGGYTVMRDAWDGQGHHLVFDVGPLGCHVSGGHGHADLLAVQCSVFGEPMLVDAGTGTYADVTWRTFFRGTAAHSTVTVDGQGQAEPAGPFAWRQRPAARLRRWLSTDAFDFADAEHDGYARLPDPVRHRRRVLFVKPRYWVLVDDLQGTEPHHIELRFQFGAAEVSLERASWARAICGGRGLLVRAFAAVPLDPRVALGGRDPVEGWISPDYGQRRPAPALVYTAVAPLPLRVVTLLLPIADPASPTPAVHMLQGDASGPAGLRFEADGEAISFDDSDSGVRLTRPTGS